MMVVMQNVAASIPCWKAMGQPMMLSRFQYFFLKGVARKPMRKGGSACAG